MANPFRGAGGGIGGPGMAKMLEQFQKKMLEDGEKMNERLDQTRVEATSGGGAVKAVVNGHGMPLEVVLDKEVVDPSDIDTLQDMVVAAFKSAWEKADTLKTDEQQKLMPSGIPGLPGLFG
ncbi:MAG TPA: YbaB/EbfC family nucleoid-associated protein [Armatimonadaceae bacterium]|nr:YbaB/EbfC family nucleoid-associated protein [Armatimonadaceae bacterium]